MIDFIIEEKNKKMFGKSARRAAEYVLSRPVKSLLPSQESSNSLRDEVSPKLETRNLEPEIQS
jgi:hypothetical protein